jgi:hypothetical protein
MCFTLEYSEVPNVDFSEFNNILYKLSSKELIFNIDKLFEFFKTLNEKPDADPINIPLLDPSNVNELNENINMKMFLLSK